MAVHEAVIAAVEAWGRGRPVAEIEAALVRELRARREFMAPDEINFEARRISDPDWAVKDPEMARRLVAEMKSPENRAAESAFRQQWERTTERLAEAVDSMQMHHLITPHDGRGRIRDPHRPMVTPTCAQAAANRRASSSTRQAVRPVVT